MNKIIIIIFDIIKINILSSELSIVSVLQFIIIHKIKYIEIFIRSISCSTESFYGYCTETDVTNCDEKWYFYSGSEWELDEDARLTASSDCNSS